jgi:hypothetical protein
MPKQKGRTLFRCAPAMHLGAHKRTFQAMACSVRVQQSQTGTCCDCRPRMLLRALRQRCTLSVCADQILQYHVVPGVAARSSQLKNGQVLTSALKKETMTVGVRLGSRKP